MSEQLQVVLAERPAGDIILGKTFKQRKAPIPKESDLKDGDILVETLYLGLDPAMRGWIRDARSYIPPVQIDEVMRGASACRVLASRNPSVKTGSFVLGYTGWQEYAILKPQMFTPPSEMPTTSNPVDLLSALGSTGLTAYFGMLEIGDPKEGDTVVVSAAAGATGSVAGQLAKIRGARVVGLAGSAEKCQWLKDDLGFDEALNYKDADFKQKFKDATPDYIDVYYDNVGGEILDMCLTRAKAHARFIMCGAISQYNSTNPYGIKNLTSVITMRIKMQGFIILDFAKDFARARKDLAQWLEAGKIKRRETIIKGGLKAAEQALIDLYKGVNTGKLMVEVKSPQDESKL